MLIIKVVIIKRTTSKNHFSSFILTQSFRFCSNKVTNHSSTCRSYTHLQYKTHFYLNVFEPKLKSTLFMILNISIKVYALALLYYYNNYYDKCHQTLKKIKHFFISHANYSSLTNCIASAFIYSYAARLLN